MAKGLIIVPKPGELLDLLGASGALAGAAQDSSPSALKLPERNYEAFKKEYLGEWPIQEPEAPARKFLGDLYSGDDNNGFIDWGADVIPGVLTEQNLRDTIAHMNALSVAPIPHELLLGPISLTPGEQLEQQLYAALDELEAAEAEMRREEQSVDIAFWYYRDTSMIYSIRRVADNFFYDFASKKFMLLTAHPRAGMPRAYKAQPSGWVYSTRLSGQLDDGEYVVTIRDGKADDVVVGIMALFMQNGAQQGKPPQGLENTPIEEGLPDPAGTFRRAARRVRSVDI